jgi:hypothetical protein
MRRHRGHRQGTRASDVQQSDLFGPPGAAGQQRAAIWQSLPQEARQALTGLVARLLLQHGAGETPRAGGRRHDL